MVVGCQPYAPAALTPRKHSWYSFLSEAESTPGSKCDRKDFMSMKNPLTPTWIELATFRFVAQHLSQCATAVYLMQIILHANLCIYSVSLSIEAPNYCLCIQSNSAGFSFVNTGKEVHLKHARRHFERNLVKDVHHRSVASRNWLKS